MTTGHYILLACCVAGMAGIIAWTIWQDRREAQISAWIMWMDLRSLGYSLPRALPRVAKRWGYRAAWSVLERCNREEKQ